jgi:hypothetical protein
MGMTPVELFYMTMVELTLGMTLRKLAVVFKASIRLVQNEIVDYLRKAVQPLTPRFPPAANASRIQPRCNICRFSESFWCCGCLSGFYPEASI